MNTPLNFWKRITSKTWFQDGMAVNLSRMNHLVGLKALLQLPGLLLFAVSVAMMWLPGFQPLWLLHDDARWFRWIILGLYASWTIWFASFVQRDDVYEDLSWGDTQGIEATGNKSIAMYAIGVMAWWIALISQQWLTGTISWWFMVVTAFLQVVPLFMGDLLQEQARRMGPLLTNVALVATTLVYIVFG